MHRPHHLCMLALLPLLLSAAKPPGASGVIRNAAEDAGRITFMVDAWPDHAYQSLIVGFRTTPRVRVNGQDVPLSQPHQFDAAAGRLVLTLTGQPVVEIAP